MSSSIRLMVVHEDALYRECLAAALAATGRFAAVALAGSVGEARAAVRHEPPDVILIHWDLPDRSALGLVRQVACDSPTVRALLLGLPETSEAVRDCAEAGGAGYVLEGESLEQVLTRIEQALRGETACSPRAARFLFAHLAGLAQQQRGPGGGRVPDLTARELQILSLIAEDLSNKEIASRLCLSLHTVKNHVHNLLEKLAVRGRHAAVRYAHEKRWLDGVPTQTSPPLPGRPPSPPGERHSAGSPPA